ncbi:hypothetical protein BGW41_002935 [Actinomortierella wolfii]|nr:hypothetical protein BGW41_002935 [Actinomortierella wolfii]
MHRVVPNNESKSKEIVNDEDLVIGIRCRSNVTLEVKLSTFCGWLSKASKAQTLELAWLSNSEHSGVVMRKIIHALPKISTLVLNIQRIEAMYQFIDSIRGKTTLLHLRLYADGLWDTNLYRNDRKLSRYWPSQEERSRECCYIQTLYVHKPIKFPESQWLELFSHLGQLTDIQATMPKTCTPNFGEELARHCPNLVGWTGSEFNRDNLTVMRPVFERLLRFCATGFHSTNWAVETLQKSCLKIEELDIAWTVSDSNMVVEHQMTSSAFQQFLESPAAKWLRKLKWSSRSFEGLQAEDVYHGINSLSKGWTCLEVRELSIQIKNIIRLEQPSVPQPTDSSSHETLEDGDYHHVAVMQGFYQQIARLEHLEKLSLWGGYIDINNMHETGLHQLSQLRKLKTLLLHVWPVLTADFFKWVIDTWPETLEYLYLYYPGGWFFCWREGVLPNTNEFVHVVIDDDGPEPEWYKKIGSQSMCGLITKKKK